MGGLYGLMSKTRFHLLRIFESKRFCHSIPIIKKLNTYQSWKIGSEEKGGGAKHWRRIAQNKHHFPEIEIFIDKDTEDNDKGISLSTRATTCQIVHRHQHSKELQCKMQGGSLRQTSLPADPSVWHMMYQISYLTGLENQISPKSAYVCLNWSKWATIPCSLC